MWKAHPIINQLNINEFFTLFRLKCSKGYTFSGETHDFWECVYIISGSTKITGGERTYLALAGDIVFHKPMELHSLSASESDAELLIFSFSMSGLLDEFFKEKCFSLTPHQNDIISQVLHITEVFKCSSLPHNNLLIPRNLSPELLQLTATRITTLFLLIYGEHSTVKVSMSPDSVIFSDMVKFLNRNIEKNITLKTLSQEFFISESSIKRIFKSHADMGVHSYFLRLKIAAAATLLKDGYTVTETAERLGFCDQSYFSTAFTRETGTTPSNYKKQYL